MARNATISGWTDKAYPGITLSCSEITVKAEVEASIPEVGLRFDGWTFPIFANEAHILASVVCRIMGSGGRRRDHNHRLYPYLAYGKYLRCSSRVCHSISKLLALLTTLKSKVESKSDHMGGESDYDDEISFPHYYYIRD